MDLKLKDNLLFSLGSTISSSITSSCTTAYVKGCPNVSGIDILRQCPNLTRIRLDIGNVSGSMEELLSYTSLSGFNDNYEPQVKPRLVGTWSVTGWYVSEQLSQAREAFDGLTITDDSNYLIDFDELAVQTLDSTKPNYNPAVAIILNDNSKGITLNNPLVSGQEGRWFLTKTEATAITSIGTWFKNKTSVTDTAGIASSIGTVYADIRFNEFRYFTGVTTFGSDTFYGSRILEIKLPNTITTIPYGFFGNTKYGLNVTIPSGVTSIPAYAFTGFPAGLEKPFITFLGNVTSIDRNSFISALKPTNPLYIHFNGNTTSPIVSAYYSGFLRGVVTVYFGDGSSKAHDDDIKASCYDDISWREKISIIDTWYNYVIPKLSYQNGQVTITVNRPSTIYYTTDGSIPTEDSTVYTEPFNWNGIGVIKTIAVSNEGEIFNTVNGFDFYANTTSNPVITYTATEVTITAEQNATIYYTLDGTCPNENSEVYTEPVAVTGNIVKVRCFARVEGKNNSEVVGKICVLDDSLWGTDGDSSYFAVQCIDNTKPNYNPAVAIILNNYFNYRTDICYNGGGYYITKTDAAAVTDIGTSYSNAYFGQKTTVTDSSGLVTLNTSATYDFTSFNEFKYFTGVTSLPNCSNYSTLNGGGAFTRCTNLQSIILPSTLTTLGTGSFGVCTSLTEITIPTGVTTIPASCFKKSACKVIVHDGITSFDNSSFSVDSSSDTIYPTIDRFPSNLISLGNQNFTHIYEYDYTLPASCINVPYGRGFKGNTSIGNAVHWLPEMLSDDSITNINGTGLNYFFEAVTKVYVGDGSSAEHDDAIVAAYRAKFPSASTGTLNKFDSWYNYLHPTT